MTWQQSSLLVLLLAAILMFMFGRWRHDMVAMAALLGCVALGLVSPGDAFAGFGHPAVITVACVLVLSRGLQTTGAVDLLAKSLLPAKAGPTLTLAALTLLGAVLSAFMNNVGALALLMPLAIQMSGRLNLTPGQVLMPLAFGSILGGMTTLIGTPPNLIVSGFRAEHSGSGFAMFDFTPVGLSVALAGIMVVLLLGRWLVPVRERAGAESFETGSYLTEARVETESKLVGKTLKETEELLGNVEAQIIGLIRSDVHLHAPNRARKLRANDILVIEAEPDGLASALSALDLRLEEDKTAEKDEKQSDDDDSTESSKASTDRSKGSSDDNEDKKKDKKSSFGEHDVVLLELVVMPDSIVANRSASDLLLRTRHSINLLAVSRQGRRSISRLRTLKLAEGDVLLVQGELDSLSEFASQHGCIPLAQRDLRLPKRREALLASTVMALAIAAAAFGLFPAAVAFAAGVLAVAALRIVPPRAIYEAVDWPVVVLLAALIPVAGAMASTGAADLIAQFLLSTLAGGNAIIALTLVLVVTMTLSDFMNNAATAAVMCPIAIGTALTLGCDPDAFLMAVAIGASCAFLTPIGHQNNTLILGPGGFRFGDYWKLGLPLEIVVVTVSVPMLLWVWPL